MRHCWSLRLPFNAFDHWRVSEPWSFAAARSRAVGLFARERWDACVPLQINLLSNQCNWMFKWFSIVLFFCIFNEELFGQLVDAFLEIWWPSLACSIWQEIEVRKNVSIWTVLVLWAHWRRNSMMCLLQISVLVKSDFPRSLVSIVPTIQLVPPVQQPMAMSRQLFLIQTRLQRRVILWLNAALARLSRAKGLEATAGVLGRWDGWADDIIWKHILLYVFVFLIDRLQALVGVSLRLRLWVSIQRGGERVCLVKGEIKCSQFLATFIQILHR